ncbi:MAG: hypothetical protein A2V83_10250 [Nitrospirae bacterium RBG_16_64_22]|nr:MAG: hypothetical protein A2V83_10250 [Nitrospirae bacterium RBG_16_64_22]
MLTQAVTRRVKYTFEDYLLFPEDGRRHEIVDGDHYVTPAPSTKHQRIVANLLNSIRTLLKQHAVGLVLPAPCDVVFSDLDVVQPDLLFVSKGRASIVTEKNIQGPPDLVIEIVSETTRRTDEILKRKLYERFGVKEYWIVDPELEAVKIYRLAAGGYERAGDISAETGGALATPLLPGLSIEVSEIFAE